MDYFFRNSYLETKSVLRQVPKKAGSDLASPSQALNIAIAISGSTKSKNVVKWALEKFSSDKNLVFKLIHVHPKITSVPTPSGRTVSISEAPEDVAATYRRQVMEKTKETLLKPYKKMCERKKVAVELQVLESNSVAVAITREVNQHLISRLVIGGSSHVGLDGNRDVTAKISAYVSELCTVYVVSKGVYILSKNKSSSDGEINETIRDSRSERADTSSYSSSSGHISAALKSKSLVLSNTRLQHLPTIARGVSVRMETSSVDSYETKSMFSDQVSKRSSPETSRTVTWNPPRSYMSSNENVNQGDDYFTDNQDTLHEIRKLKDELRQAQEMYAMAQVETLDASLKLNELEFEELKLKENGTKGLEEKETQKFEQMRRETREVVQKREAREKEDKLKERSLVAPKLQYQEFTWEEIKTATSSFSEDLKIGNGAYGAVYKCKLRHTFAAVKVLHSAESNLSKQFDQETSPVGTLCYIDPEYQRSGMLSFKSDVYAFGMIILQLLTALPAIALTYKVETAMGKNDEFIQILDKKAGDWPMEETRKLAALALSCTEIRAKDRPDLETHILPALESLKNVAVKSRNLISSAPNQPPSHFLCPLLKEVMSDPCVAADGYTYDRRAIEEWMEDHCTSPVTNLPLQNINLLPNHSVCAAIGEWRHKNQ
uniref:RING-type E3 ubiquitin transferase n=1 Tax=Brassica campestris TaxID=3711 RepID=M4DFC4_BRACM